MKRHLTKEESHIKKELERVARTRKLHRDRRDRIGLKTISIVGYTNAGKSSLLNALTKKGAYVANELFATLDTRVGKVWIPSSKTTTFPIGTDSIHPPTPVLLSDTIGFIQDLPPQLIQAFRSTLDETIDADLILHVIDASDPYLTQKIAEVEDILAQLNLQDAPSIYIFNKIDSVKRLARATLGRAYKSKTPVFVSAVKGLGLDELKAKIGERLGI
jgi:GTP-binding protein HflX